MDAIGIPVYIINQLKHSSSGKRKLSKLGGQLLIDEFAVDACEGICIHHMTEKTTVQTMRCEPSPLCQVVSL